LELGDAPDGRDDDQRAGVHDLIRAVPIIALTTGYLADKSS
jgi:hypothetical protein